MKRQNEASRQIATNSQSDKLAALALASSILFTCTPEPINYDCLQGEWISCLTDTAATNEISNKPASASAGKLIWSVKGDRQFATDHSIDRQEDSLPEFETVSISELRLKKTSQSNFIVRKTDPVFAAKPMVYPALLCPLIA
jgi:hypothetical protein